MAFFDFLDYIINIEMEESLGFKYAVSDDLGEYGWVAEQECWLVDGVGSLWLLIESLTGNSCTSLLCISLGLVVGSDSPQEILS